MFKGFSRNIYSTANLVMNFNDMKTPNVRKRNHKWVNWKVIRGVKSGRRGARWH